jgi:tetrahydromethanopterin S-methyltransferase subunit G
MELSDEQFERLTESVAERIGKQIEQRIPALLTSVSGSGAARTGDAPRGAGFPSGAEAVAPILYVPPEFWEAQVEFRKDIAEIRIQMAVFQERFEAMDKRFEAIDKRFDDLIHYVDKRFSSLQWFMGIGFSLIVALMSLYNFTG